ncbi:MAG TPA: M48 family metalloprotease [Tepidisphaeraceae bacterium]|jgi:Zn-dependent protease with chaperone function|nr:M48 family metalloprotease [Tepidisphaeraceae bacterium]
MPISDQKTRARLSFLEAEARRYPRRHRMRLLGVAMLGYAYPLGLLLGCLLVVLAMTAAIPLVVRSDDFEFTIIYLFFFVSALLLSAMILRTFFVKLPDPDAPALGANDAPALRAMIEEVRQVLKSPPIHRICIDMRVNAAVAQRAKFGLWGPKTNYLIVGLPLLMAITSEEFRLVLAHEMGHLRGRHNRFSAWIYRIGQTWQELAGSDAKQGWLRRFIMGWFVKRYGTYLWISTLALRRLYEYEADLRGGEVGGAQQAGHVLFMIEWIIYRLERSFWPALLREAGAEPLPPADMLLRLSQFLATDPDPQQLSLWRRREQRACTPITSEHPCLADRMESLGCRDLLERDQPDAAANIEASAVALLGESRARQWQITNASWKASIIQYWRQQHAAAKYWKEKPEKEQIDNLDGEWEALQARAALSPPEQAKQMLSEFLLKHSDHAAANYALGQLLLQDDDDAAAGCFEKAMRSTDFLAPSLHLLLDYYREVGRDDDADPIRQRLLEYERDFVIARKERLKVKRWERFERHDLKEEQIEEIRRILYRYPQVRSAWLARKKVRLFTDKPSYVLVIRRRWGMFDGTAQADKFLSAWLSSQISVPCTVVILTWTKSRPNARLLSVCSGPIYDVE